MRRLYYLADDVDTTKRVSDALHAEGIGDWNFHVLAKDEAGLYTHHLHAATTYQQLDVVHMGERYALMGAAAGLAVAMICYALQPLPFDVGGVAIAVITVIGGLIGAWQGGMIGMTRENYQIAPFHDEIEAGRYLIMVDVKAENRALVREIMNMQFRHVAACGSSGTLINPFESPARIYQQTTR
jgi:hypothetical protein